MIRVVSFFFFIMNGYSKMKNDHYSDNELHLMSYQDLRRLSILLQLPANIKKKYMISMIQAHQKGDGYLKTAIANKILEERKVKRLNNNKKKQSKSYMINSSVNSQQIPTDLSVSTQHEFETRFSYVAHFSSKDEIRSGISRIIKQETEVSRRNRTSARQPKKSTRKLSTVGKTEIMLPRNHSLTTPVRLMPQYEKGIPPPGDYETLSGISNAKNHFQDLNYNYHFHGEFSNHLLPTTSHELYRSEPYWHTREMYNNSLMPILSSLLTPNSVTINSSSYASQYTSSNSIKGPTSFQPFEYQRVLKKQCRRIPSSAIALRQGVYENYVKNNSMIESQAFQSGVTNSSTLIADNSHVINENIGNTYNINRGNYIFAKDEVDFEISSSTSEINCQHCRRDESVIKSSNESQSFLNFHSSRNAEAIVTAQGTHPTSVRDVPQFNSCCFRIEDKDIALPIPHRPYETSMIAYKTTEIIETDGSDYETAPPVLDDYESSYTEEDNLWEESENGLKKLIGKSRLEKDNMVVGFFTPQGQGSYLSEVSDPSANMSIEAESINKLTIANEKEILSDIPQFSRCPYTLGHNKYPETVSDSNKITTLPSFLYAFCSNDVYNRAYSVCKNSFTGTTETHLNPIMTCTYASQFASHTISQAQPNNICSGNQSQRQWYYTCPDSQVPFSVDSASYTGWNEYSSESENKVIAQNNNHSFHVVKCRTHGCHYLYSLSNSRD